MSRLKEIPYDLFRIQGSNQVKLREFSKQMALGRRMYDYRVHEDGLIHPVTDTAFVTPNGASVRPVGHTFNEIVCGFRGNACIYCLKKGTQLPEGLVLILEHTDHFSIQTTVACTPKEFQQRVDAFFRSFPVLTKSQYLQQYAPHLGYS